MAQKCSDCAELHNLIIERKASHMPNKCFPKGGKPCDYLTTSDSPMNNISTKMIWRAKEDMLHAKANFLDITQQSIELEAKYYQFLAIYLESINDYIKAVEKYD